MAKKSKPTDTEKFLTEAKEEMKVCIDGWSKNIELARADIRMLDYDQWPDEIKRERQADGRPFLTFDKLNQSVRQVINDIRQNSPTIQIQPAEADNEKVKNLAGNKDYSKAEVYEGLIRNIESVSRASIAYDTAGEQAGRGGFGYFRLLTEYADDSGFDQDIRIKRVRNQFAVYLDPNFTEPDGSDANFGYVVERMTKKAFEKKYPGKSCGELERSAGDSWWFDGENVRIAERYKRIPVKKKIFRMSDGSVIDKEEVLDELAGKGITVEKVREVDTYKVEWSKITGDDILEGPQEFPSKYIPIIPVLGEELIVDGEPVYRSVVRGGHDAQRAYNYERTTDIERGALEPKIPFIVGTSQVKGELQKIWSSANKKNHAYLPYDDSENPNPPQRNLSAQTNPGNVNRAMMANDDIKASTGIYDASLGARSNEQSGKAILARQREGDISTFAFSDNLARSIQHCGRILLDMIPRVYDSTRVVRVKFPDDSEDFVEINKTIYDIQSGEEITVHDLSYGRYDAVVSVGPSYSTQRVESAEAMFQAVQANPQLWTIIGDMLIKNTDWPGSDEMAKRMRKTINPALLDADSEEAMEAQQAAQQPTVEQQLQKMSLDADQSKHQATMAKAEADVRKAEASTVEAQADIMTAQVDMAALQAQVADMNGTIQNLAGLLQQLVQPQPQQGAFLLPDDQA